MANLPAKRRVLTQKGLQRRVDGFFRQLGCPKHFVTVERTRDGKVWASALGLMLGQVPIGKITVDHALLSLLDKPEVEFVLAHEVAHIREGHLLVTGGMTLLRTIFDAEAKHDVEVRGLLMLWDLMKVVGQLNGSPPPDAVATRAQELEADAWAVALTENVDAAESALMKLTGNNRSAPSHSWEAFGVPVPVMSVGERVDILRKRCGLAPRGRRRG